MSVNVLDRPDAADLARRHDDLLRREPKLRQRDIAERLGVSEAELLAAGLGRHVVRLQPQWPSIMAELPTLGTVMALTRNDHCVHEKVGTYKAFSVNGHVGLFLGEAIDLRIFFQCWRFGFAVTETGKDGEKRSLQFFDGQGRAIHKVFLRPESDEAAWRALVARFAGGAVGDVRLEPAPAAPAEQPDDRIDAAGLRAAWDALQDTHDFHGMLRRFGAGRVQALRLGGIGRARRTTVGALRAILERAAGDAMPIMVFVGNPGMIQIHTGPVSRLLATGPWFNVLDPGFNLHLREDAIDTAWIVRKPTVDGDVTSLEMFDAAGGTIATLFGKRKPGMPEDPAWRSAAHALPSVPVAQAAA
ncbi:MAG: hemin-degrading factor [Alphaproteobacteria bacterium]|nr:hemin-degrading factor [Alphaproteobacteria bacterium]